MIRRYLSGEAGGVTIQMLLFSIVFFILGGLAVDVTNAYRMRTTMQATADAAALAGARELPTQEDAKTMAATFVELNMPTSVHGTLAQPTDYEVGNWDLATGSFVNGATPYNAMRVSLSRTDSYGNSLATFLLKFGGMDAWDIRIRSTAMGVFTPPPCVGMVSDRYVDMNSSNTIGPDFCIYGREFISTGSNFTGEPGAKLYTLNDGPNSYPIDFRPNSGAVVSGVDMDTSDLPASRARKIAQTIDDWIADEAADRAAPFGYSFQVVAGSDVSNVPDPPAPNTIYLFKSGASFGSGFDHAMSNVIFAVKGNLDFGSGAKIRNANDCEAANPIGIFASKEIKFGSDSDLDGVDIISGKNVDLGQNGHNKQVIIEAVDLINTGSSSSFRVCKQLAVPGAVTGSDVLALVQ